MRFGSSRSLAIMAGLVAIVIAATPETSKATLRFRVEQTSGPSGPAGPAEVVDNGPGDNNLTLNAINSSGMFGDFIVDSQITATSNSPGTATNGNIHFNTIDIRNNSAGTATLVIEVTDKDFTLPGTSTSPMMIQSSFTGSYTSAGSGDNVTFIGGADAGNQYYVQSTATATQTGSVTSVNNPLVTTFVINPVNPNANFTRSGDYSLTTKLTVVLSAGGSFNLTGDVTAIALSAVPEPASFAMCAGAVLPLMAYGLRRRRRQS